MPGGYVVRAIRGSADCGMRRCASKAVCLVDFYQTNALSEIKPFWSEFMCDAHRCEHIAGRGDDQWARDCTTDPETIYAPASSQRVARSAPPSDGINRACADCGTCVLAVQ